MIEELTQKLQRTLSTERIVEILAEIAATAPDQAYPILVEQLQGSHEVLVQQQALRLLAQVQLPPEAEDILLHYLVEPYPWDIRQAASQTLAQQVSAATLPKLQPHLQSRDWDLLAQIVAILGRSALPEGLPLILSQAHHANPFVRKSVAEALGSYARQPEAQQQLLELLLDENEFVVLAATHSLKSGYSCQAVRQLNSLQARDLSGDTQTVIKGAIEQITENARQTAADEGVPPVQRLQLLGEWALERPEMRAELENQLSHFSDKLAAYSPAEQQEITATVLKMEAEGVGAAQEKMLKATLARQILPEALLATPSAREKLTPALVKIAAGSPGPQKERAIQTLVQLDQPQIIPQLLFLLDDEDLAFEQGQPLLVTHPGETLQALASYLKKQPSQRARERIAGLLQATGDPRASGLLLKMLPDSGDSLRSRIKEALASFGGTIVDLLAEMIGKSTDRNFKQDCLEILGQLPPSENSADTLMKLLSSQDEALQEQAGELLSRLDARTPRLIEMYLDPGCPVEQQQRLRAILKQRSDSALGEAISLLPVYVQGSSREPFILLLLEILQAQPHRSSQMLLPLLKHQKEAVRLETIALMAQLQAGILQLGPMAQLQDTQALPAVIALLKETSPALQARVLEVLPQWGSASVPHLLEIAGQQADLQPVLVKGLASLGSYPLKISLQSDQSLPAQQCLLAALGLCGDAGAARNIEPFLASPAPAVRLAAVRALQQLSAREAGPALLPLLQDADLLVQAAAIEACGELGVAAGLETIAARLESPHKALLLAALGATGKLLGLPWLPRMVSLLKTACQEKDAELKAGCIQALGFLNTRAALEPLQSLLSEEMDRAVVLLLLDALAHIRLPETVALLTRFFENPEHDEPSRLHVITLLGRMEMAEGYHYLIASLPNQPLPIQRRILAVLGLAPQRWILSTLLTYLKAPDWHLQRSAIEALGHFAHMDALNPLKQHLKQVQDNQHVWGWILRSAIWDAQERIRGKNLLED